MRKAAATACVIGDHLSLTQKAIIDMAELRAFRREVEHPERVWFPSHGGFSVSPFSLLGLVTKSEHHGQTTHDKEQIMCPTWTSRLTRSYAITCSSSCDANLVFWKPYPPAVRMYVREFSTRDEEQKDAHVENEECASHEIARGAASTSEASEGRLAHTHMSRLRRTTQCGGTEKRVSAENHGNSCDSGLPRNGGRAVALRVLPPRRARSRRRRCVAKLPLCRVGNDSRTARSTVQTSSPSFSRLLHASSHERDVTTWQKFEEPPMGLPVGNSNRREAMFSRKTIPVRVVRGRDSETRSRKQDHDNHALTT
ncbi:hypothetical protein BC827DRAFT_1158047 [Russula dissimulans]|nr:hypothetical protein BC827DRAFT_1158047 [Russula dissimulans]